MCVLCVSSVAGLLYVKEDVLPNCSQNNDLLMFFFIFHL